MNQNTRLFIHENALENVICEMVAILSTGRVNGFVTAWPWPKVTNMAASKFSHSHVNTLRPRQNGRHFPDNIFKWIFLNENAWIWINISLKFVPRGPINNIPTLVQVMAWRRPGDKPLSEPMMVRLPTHICVTQPQWVNQVSASW